MRLANHSVGVVDGWLGAIQIDLYWFSGTSIARQINNLATAGLLHASACNVVRVDETLFQQTTSEFHV